MLLLSIYASTCMYIRDWCELVVALVALFEAQARLLGCPSERQRILSCWVLLLGLLGLDLKVESFSTKRADNDNNL